MSKSFSLYAEDLARSIELMFVAALREGVSKGIEKATTETYKDSGNAAVHWMVGIEGDSDPQSRPLGNLQDLRETNKGPVHPWVRKRRSHIGRNSEMAKMINLNVLDREVTEVISQYIVGQKPSIKYVFYNAVADESDYAKKANVALAGHLAVETALDYFDAQIRAGNIRKYRRR